MRNLFQKLALAGILLLSTVFFANSANACSCYNTQTVDQEFLKTPNVVVLKLQSIKQADGEPANYFLSVEKIFKGGLKINEILTFAGGSNCRWYFSEEEIGTEYLFYLDEKPATGEPWRASKCSRSGRIEDKTEDLRYLENEKKLRGKTRLSGTVQKLIETPDEFERFSLFPLADRKLRITGNGKNIELVTDENGVYEIYDLPAGKYQITPEKVDGFVFSSKNAKFIEVEMTAKSHTEKNIIFSISNAISGKVVDPSGKPIENACVDLVSTKTEKAPGYDYQSCTDEKGEFEISSIGIGTYWIAINNDGKITLDQPFHKFFYPNVKSSEKAVKISVGANYFLKDLILVPPEMAEMITLTGKMSFADGKPAADEMVQFLTVDQAPKSPDGFVISDFEVKTDKTGQFTLKTLKGQAGILRGIVYSFSGAYINCPQIEEILKFKKGIINQIETNRLEITGNQNSTGIELKFPFPACKKAKTEEK